eukprot:1158312-Pelagomonas_calceolata.AAC.7
MTDLLLYPSTSKFDCAREADAYLFVLNSHRRNVCCGHSQACGCQGISLIQDAALFKDDPSHPLPNSFCACSSCSGWICIRCGLQTHQKWEKQACISDWGQDVRAVAHLKIKKRAGWVHAFATATCPSLHMQCRLEREGECAKN